MIAKYKADSPWHNTKIIQDNYLDILSIRSVPAESDDYLYTIQEQYTHRPDLLAYDLYKNKNLWWVFAQRNPDQIEDPIYDFKPGVTIKLPKPGNVSSDLGV